MIHTPQSTDISSALLEQNTPNPFTKSTIINYTLPHEYKNAKILIVDKSGRSIKEIFVNGEGSIKVDTSMLAAGTYTYSLYVNGKLISTKQMVNTK